MKQLFLLLAIVLFASSCAHKTVDNLFSHYKKDDSFIAATIPGWFVKKGLHLALKHQDVEHIDDIRKIVKNVDKLRFLVSSNLHESVFVKNMSTNLRSEQYELFGLVSNEDAKINIWVKEKDGNIEDIFFFIKSDEEVVLVQIKGDIDMNALEKVQSQHLSFKQI